MPGVIYESQEQLNTALAYWQDILRLRDWKLKAEIAREKKMSQLGRQAEVSVDEQHKYARIWLMSPEDFPEDVGWEQDHEESLVHELLHVHLWVLEPDKEDPRGDIPEEQAINSIVSGLIRLKRG